jgi:hypothetical protein
VQEHYQKQSLDAAAITRLQKIARTPRPLFRLSRLAAAAVVLLAVGASFYGLWQQAGARLSREVAADVARQHVQAFASQFVAEDFKQLETSMPQLGFTPIEPQVCKQDDYRVTGARYAKVGGKTVAQIRLAYVEGAPLSLYEMRADDFPRVREGKTNIEGTPVTIWRENGLLMALAGTPAE